LYSYFLKLICSWPNYNMLKSSSLPQLLELCHVKLITSHRFNAILVPLEMWFTFFTLDIDYRKPFYTKTKHLYTPHFFTNYFSIVHINIISSISRSFKLAATLNFQATNIYNKTVSPSTSRNCSLRNNLKFLFFFLILRFVSPYIIAQFK
jgi:hypothetical protein